MSFNKTGKATTLGVVEPKPKKDTPDKNDETPPKDKAKKDK
jgi:hypothetical protein